MKTIGIIFFAAILSCSSLFATDINVNETGSAGAYTTITAALTAAVDGDRIFVEPKAGGAAYIESLSITKSVQILSKIESQKFAVQGDVNITPSTIEDVVIIGMALAGNLSSTGDASAAGRTKVKILFCELDGNITFNNNNYFVVIANSEINGAISFRSGHIIGNVINSSSNHSVYIGDEDPGGAAHISDTIRIIGNRISNSSTSYFGINGYTYDYFYQICNNYIYYTSRGIYLSRWNTSLDGTNEIMNNTLKRYSTSTTNYGMTLSGITTGGVVKVYNNLFDGYSSGSTDYAMYYSAMENGIVYTSYNYFDAGFDYYLYSFTNDGTNVTGASFTIDAVSGQPSSGTYANVGHPDNIYYDLDLTRNDVGCYGGSYSAINYFPIGDSNNARVFDLKIPRAVYSGNPIRVEAEGFDK